MTTGKKGTGRGTPVKKDDEASTRAKTDEDEEKEEDRKARLRVGAFGATEWVLSGCPMSLVYCMYKYLMRFLFSIHESFRCNHCAARQDERKRWRYCCA